ncbi:MAG: DUF3102 domain-containing protein [Flavonifractor plautii]|nr:DUF3102 domain-containing protein [Flavonifractor plautii]MDU6289786.1 DUF3102 domain-containing protein [Flavonifractor plautii]MDU6342367.1 DUF3102 domain-containing protein [Flavonifractor plautii]
MSRFDITQAFQQAARPAAPAERTIEAITGDILEAQRKGGEAILTIGNCLIEAKSMLLHGEWLPWLNSKVGYSEKTAQNFMRLAREFSNPQALADLGATKALALLALPTEERERFLEDHNVIDMTTRQLEQAIKERDEARKAAEQARADASAAEQARAKMAEDVAVANASLEGARADKQAADKEIVRLTRELDALKSTPVDVAVETVVDQKAIDRARADAVAEMQVKLEKAREAKVRAEEKQKIAEDALEDARRHLEEQAKAEKRAALGADKDLAQFELLFQQAQETANKMHGILLMVRSRDEDAAVRLAKALRALAEAVGRCAE